MKNAPASVQEAGRFGEQLTLVPNTKIIPLPPSAHTLASSLLAMLAAGDVLDHPVFLERTGSGRLAAVVQELQELGWQVYATRIPAPTAWRPDRRIAHYWMSPAHRRLAQEVAK